MESAIEQRVLDEARRLFLRYGSRSVTMDELAARLGVSKKTIYQHYPNKPALVEAVVGAEIGEQQQVCNELCQQAVNPIDEMFRIHRYMNRKLADMAPGLVFEVRKYYPAAAARLDEHLEGYVAAVVHQNLQRGQDAGLYRPDLNLPIIVRYYLQVALLPFDISAFPTADFTPSQIHRQVILHFLHGIACGDGLRLLHDYKSQLP